MKNRKIEIEITKKGEENQEISVELSYKGFLICPHVSELIK